MQAWGDPWAQLKLPFQEFSGTLVKHKDIGISEYPSAQKQRDCAELEICISQPQPRATTLEGLWGPLVSRQDFWSSLGITPS